MEEKPTENTSTFVNEMKRFNIYRKILYRILGNTEHELSNVANLNIIALQSNIAEDIAATKAKVFRTPTIIVLGSARARLVNFLLGEKILPDAHETNSNRGWRWIRLQYGSKRQIRLGFGSDYEIIEPNLSSNFDWKQISSQSLNRNDTSDLSTIIDIDLCNNFLETGVQILVPPDLGDHALYHKLPFLTNEETVLNDYEDLFYKRGMFLENVIPIILYALRESDSIEVVNTHSKLSKSISSEKECVPGHSGDTYNIFNVFKKFKIHCDKTMSKFYVDSDAKKDNKSSTSSDSDCDSLNNSNISKNLVGLSEEKLLDMRQIFELYPNVQVLFILFSNFQDKNMNQELNHSSNSHAESSQKHTEFNTSQENNNDFEIDERKGMDKEKLFLNNLIKQLSQISNPLSKNSTSGKWIIVNNNQMEPSSDIASFIPERIKSKKEINCDVFSQRSESTTYILKFIKECLKEYIMQDCQKLSKTHNTLLQQFILTSYDMAREMQIIPRRIRYVSKMEQNLFDTLNNTFTNGEKHKELTQITEKILKDMENNVDSIIANVSDDSLHESSECINSNRSASLFYMENTVYDPDMKENEKPCTSTATDTLENREQMENEEDDILKEYDVIAIPSTEFQISEAVEALEEQNEQTLESNVDTINTNINIDHSNTVTFSDISVPTQSQVSFRQVSLDIKRTILSILSRNTSIHLIKFVDCVRDSYYGTLQRCIESLEVGQTCKIASEAIRNILNVTKTVDLQHCKSFSFFRVLLNQLKRLFQRLLSPSNNTSCCTRNIHWRRQVALDTIQSLNATRLTKLISTQLRERIRSSHEQFQSALYLLGEHHTLRLQQTEDLKLSVRKSYAPCFARLCLESTSLCDSIDYGMPHLYKEIGRGQYGVVYSVRGSWAGYNPCAVKSVIPPDERHFNELAMEFFNTRNIPYHERIVRLRGSVIDYAYGIGTPAVLLISERLKCDLHFALSHSKMSFIQRMQIAIDIVKGIRYLHSRGLVHRDIKLKNVVLDEVNRAKLTDMGFCMPEALMSGSVVGTPIHMAPELLSGSYDNSVDVYAFGILFWYICSGHIKTPSAFERFQNKEQLWNSVKKGVRPEKLSHFYETCWSLMEKCWATEPSERPLPGDVQRILKAVKRNPNIKIDI